MGQCFQKQPLHGTHPSPHSLDWNLLRVEGSFQPPSKGAAAAGYPFHGSYKQFSLFLAPHVFHLSCKALSSFQDRSSHTHPPLALLKPMWMVLSHVPFDWWIYSLLSLLLSSHRLDWLSQLVGQAVLPPRLQALKQDFSFVLGVSPAPQTTHRHLSKRDLLPENEWMIFVFHSSSLPPITQHWTSSEVLKRQHRNFWSQLPVLWLSNSYMRSYRLFTTLGSPALSLFSFSAHLALTCWFCFFQCSPRPVFCQCLQCPSSSDNGSVILVTCFTEYSQGTRPLTAFTLH